MRWIKDPETQLPSVPLTAFVCGFAVCIVKLALSGIKLVDINIAEFSGSDFSMAVAALGAIYSLHTHVQNLANKNDKSQ